MQAVGIRGDYPSELLDDADQQHSLKESLNQAGELLLPSAFSEALLAQDVDTLLVVPITIHSVDENDQPSMELLANIAATPVSLLPLKQGKRVMDEMSVLIVPGFASLSTDVAEHRSAHRSFKTAVLVEPPFTSKAADVCLAKS
jgi:hypothetical protein